METIESRARAGAALRLGAGPVLWQRTDVIGTELVQQAGAVPGVATGSGIVGGSRPFSTRWQAGLRADWTLDELAVECAGYGWRRALTLTRGDDDAWTCRTENVGELDAPPAGIDDVAALGAVVRLADSPIFLTWAMRALSVRPDGPAVSAPTARILTPSLGVVLGVSRYQRLSDQRLRVTGDEPAASYDLDTAGVVTYQPGRLRIVH